MLDSDRLAFSSTTRLPNHDASANRTQSTTNVAFSRDPEPRGHHRFEEDRIRP